MGARKGSRLVSTARERGRGAIRHLRLGPAVWLAAGLILTLASGCTDNGVDPNGPDGDPAPEPVIDSVYVEGLPIEPFTSDGDLWMSTWAADGSLYCSWGDGEGVVDRTYRTDCGIARLHGALPQITAEERCERAPTVLPRVDDKPSSLLAIGGRLYGHFHSPLGDAWIGYLAYSDDDGATWTRVGYYEEGSLPPLDASPWTRDRNSRFRCMFFINMGQNYELNQDGYVYALAIGKEWNWLGGVYLARVPVTAILDYGAYEYMTSVTTAGPQWSRDPSRAIAVPTLRTRDQGSAMYHPGIQRYLFLTSSALFEAPEPWGPWFYAGSWVHQVPIEWQDGYQPGIISKDTEPNAFWFTISGQSPPPRINYKLHLGRMVMRPVASD